MIFVIVVLICLILFLLFLNYNKEYFINYTVEPDDCNQSSGKDDLEIVTVDGHKQYCYNKINKNNTIVGGATKLYLFDGLTSFVYVRDYYDNFINISMKVQFENLTQTQTLVDSKYYKIQIKKDVNKKGKLTITVNSKSKSIQAIETGKIYLLSITQDKKDKKIYMNLSDVNKFLDKGVTTELLDMPKNQKTIHFKLIMIFTLTKTRSDNEYFNVQCRYYK